LIAAQASTCASIGAAAATSSALCSTWLSPMPGL
jgi:hypothetical protein